MGERQQIFPFSFFIFTLFLYLCTQNMMLELHNVTIGQQIRSLSLTVEDGQLVCLSGSPGSGKSTLLRAIMGFLPVDAGHISIDGELLTPKSAPYFRRQMAYVPQHLEVPEGYPLDTDYVKLLTKAIESGKPLMIVDEPPKPIDGVAETLVDNLLRDASLRGISVLAVNERITQNQVKL